MKLRQKQLHLSLVGAAHHGLLFLFLFWKFTYNSPKEEQLTQGIALADPLPTAWRNEMVLVWVSQGLLTWFLVVFLL